MALIPYFEPGTRPSGKCTAAVREGRLVAVSATPSGGMAGTENMQIKESAGATEVPVAVACLAGEINEEIPLLGLRSSAIVPLVAGAAIVYGELLMSDSQGRVIPFVGPIATTTVALPDLPVHVGVAVETQATVDANVGVWLI